MKLPVQCPGLRTALRRDDRRACDHNLFFGSPFMVLLLLLRWSSSGGAAIRLQDDGGYVDLVVAVHEALPVELELVEQLKDRTQDLLSFSPGTTPHTADASGDYLLVHEWAHLRYGVFDEFGFPKDPLYPAVYMRGRKTLSNTCSARIVTSRQKEDGAPCGIIEGTLESGCVDFEPVPEMTDARSSIMFLPPLPTVLQSGGAEGSAMLLITDGEENEPPFLSGVLPLLLQKRITLHTLALTSDAQASLEKAARDTGGRAFTTAGSDDVVTGIADVFSSAAVEQLDEATRPVTLFSEMVNATTFDVPLDDELGRDTQFVSSSQHLEVVSPSGERLLGSYDASLLRSKLLLDRTWTGLWTVRLSEPARVSITSRPSRSGPVTQLRAFLGNGVLERAAGHMPPAALHAELVRGARPLLGAHVTASVRTPRGVEVHLPLRDDGAGIDVAARDGVYSAAFIAFDVAGRYAVQLRARGRRGNGSFVRFSDAGSLWVGAVDGDLAYPPSTVRDLRVEGARPTSEGWLITLAWTAPGDQMDQGLMMSP
ncbi:hypothetical protein HPB52_010002 [Rhipicephalus sanguineus]|uniref:Calcium-activated chloride channel N-terminal domain-containing protein n=1 Tax=Rhipicephalus sanguineus TaxID=34632 RepID=A0A9D4SY64_RHISA|nr:hypothetical protein HPB52_010002 [Rhipicephalus sanguineus]